MFFEGSEKRRYAQVLASVAALAVSLLPIAAHSHAAGDRSIPGSSIDEVESLAKNLDNVIKVCEALVVRATTKDNVALPDEKYAVDKGLLAFFASPPADLVANTNPKFGTARYAQWLDPHARVYIIAYETKPMCRVFVMDSEWTRDIRPTLSKLIQVGGAYKPTELETPIGPNLLRSIFRYSLPKAATDGIIALTADDTAVASGALQLSIAVGLTTRDVAAK